MLCCVHLFLFWCLSFLWLWALKSLVTSVSVFCRIFSKFSWIVNYRSTFRRMNCSLNWSSLFTSDYSNRLLRAYCWCRQKRQCQQSVFSLVGAYIRIWCTAGAVERRSRRFVFRPYCFSLFPVPPSRTSTEGLFTGYTRGQNSGASGDQAPVKQQPCSVCHVFPTNVTLRA